MKSELQINIPPRPVKTLGCFLGSFDPFHKGHEWITEKLLTLYDAAILWIPAVHFEKKALYPENATYEQRLDMLTAYCTTQKGRLGLGLTREVLFIRLHDAITGLFPGIHVYWGMGEDTYHRFRLSKEYYPRMGIDWTAADARKLNEMNRHITVFSRSGNATRFIRPPKAIQSISSTTIRKKVFDLHAGNVSGKEWHRRLTPMVRPEIIDYIQTHKIYTSASG